MKETKKVFYCTTCESVRGLPIPTNFKEAMPSPPEKSISRPSWEVAADSLKEEV